MEIRENVNLNPYHTFRTGSTARRFIELQDNAQIMEFLASPEGKIRPLLILGGGSNLLFSADFDGLVARIATKGMEIVSEHEETVKVRVMAGVNWDSFVGDCVEKGWGGLENLSLIPGNVGTAPVQNIGAYGVEVNEFIREVQAVEVETAKEAHFSCGDCAFGYRESRFKGEWKGKYIITSVVFELSRKPEVRAGYGTIKEELAAMSVAEPAIRDVREAVIRIRTRKLPDPAVIGNAGSFFKNPVVDDSTLAALKAQYPEMPSYPGKERIKIPAAWMIEHCGWKGKRNGDAGIHPNQPLVLVNYGKATGKEILDLATLVRQSVFAKFGVLLEPEVNII